MSRARAWLGIALFVGAVTWAVIAIVEAARECSGVAVLPGEQR
jgi:hypothetical protein